MIRRLSGIEIANFQSIRVDYLFISGYPEIHSSYIQGHYGPEFGVG
jgi:hypothetical protein